VAAQIGDVMTTIPAALALVLFPALVRSDRRRLVARQALVAAAGLQTALCLLAALVSPYLLPLLFGREFSPSVPVFLWSLPGVFFLGLISVASQYLAAVGFPWSLVGLWAGAAALVVAASTVLIPPLGAVGAAALSGTYVCLFAGVLVLVRRKARAEARLSST